MEFQTIKDVEKFFKDLSGFITEEITVYLLGGCALLALGASRSTQDIDFEIKCLNSDTIDKIFNFCMERKTAVNFSEDVGKWGMINISSNRNSAKFFAKYGTVLVNILSPFDMIIGKIERFTDTDIEDVLFLLKKNHINSDELLTAWANALKNSLKSEKSFLFQRQVEVFVTTYSKEIWGVEHAELLYLWNSLIKEN